MPFTPISRPFQASAGSNFLGRILPEQIDSGVLTADELILERGSFVVGSYQSGTDRSIRLITKPDAIDGTKQQAWIEFLNLDGSIGGAVVQVADNSLTMATVETLELIADTVITIGGNATQITYNTASETITILDAVILNDVGSTTAPSYAFASYADTGLYLNDGHANYNDGVGIAHDGLNAFSFSRASDISYMHFGEFNDWLQYNNSSEQLALYIGNVLQFTIDASSIELYGTEFRVNKGSSVQSTNVRDTTTSSSANVNIGTGGGAVLARSTSSARYKASIRPWDDRHSVLDLTPSLYRSLSKQDDSRKLRLGLIAEDVAEHFPLAAVYDAEGRPDAVDWNPVIAGLIAEVKELKATVAELQSRH